MKSNDAEDLMTGAIEEGELINGQLVNLSGLPNAEEWSRNVINNRSETELVILMLFGC